MLLNNAIHPAYDFSISPTDIEERQPSLSSALWPCGLFPKKIEFFLPMNSRTCKQYYGQEWQETWWLSRLSWTNSGFFNTFQLPFCWKFCTNSSQSASKGVRKNYQKITKNFQVQAYWRHNFCTVSSTIFTMFQHSWWGKRRNLVMIYHSQPTRTVGMAIGIKVSLLLHNHRSHMHAHPSLARDWQERNKFW